MAGAVKGLVITMRPIIGIVTLPWVAAMALFASIEYGDFASSITSDSMFYNKLLLIILASYLGVTSGYAVNDYYDANLDVYAPIPKAIKLGIPKRTLLVYAAVLGIPSIVILFYLNPLTGMIGIIQMISIFAYSKYMKGNAPYSNLFVVIPTALMPFGVFFVYTNAITIEAILLFVIFFFFEPGFTWSGVCRDYEYDKKRGVPTLPVKYGIKATAKFIFVCWTFVLFMSIVLFLFTNLGVVFLIGSVFSGILLIIFADNLVKIPRPDVGAKTFIRSAEWFWLFSFSMIIDIALRMANVVIFKFNALG
ncbi:MAG: UbiA prenyltransferase family protein [Thermoplasmata archaeon]|nr:MAG: UbiA prenyltransferase family protein [Thermoplasmata archaeon]